jgi:hypothetical protein
MAANVAGASTTRRLKLVAVRVPQTQRPRPSFWMALLRAFSAMPV